jgi:hypothetical protein
MKFTSFTSQQLAHDHSVKNILTEIYKHNEFMESISRMVDLGCQSEGLDLQWWANAETNDDSFTPLEIKCTGVNSIDKLAQSNTMVLHFKKAMYKILIKLKNLLMYCGVMMYYNT